MSSSPLAGLLKGAQAFWRGRASRERLAMGLAAAALLGALLWLLALQPAWRTLKAAPAQFDALDAQWQTMQQLATEARELRAAPAVNAEQVQATLRAAVDRLGDKARLTLQGERALVSFDAVSSSALREWLQDVRSAARARPMEASLNRTPQGYSGSVVLALPPGSGGTP
jgi:general secretion pathway protein M